MVSDYKMMVDKQNSPNFKQVHPNAGKHIIVIVVFYKLLKYCFYIL